MKFEFYRETLNFLETASVQVDLKMLSDILFTIVLQLVEKHYWKNQLNV